MGQKDIAEKVLESYNDVFADIVNGFVFKGKKVVKEDDLQEMSPVSAFKSGRKYHKQERDVAKLWKENGIRVALCGIENQTTVDSSMPLRVIAYDGMAYKKQLIDNKKSKKKKKKDPVEQPKFYPVITFVLYLGDRPWNNNKNLLDVLTLRPEFKPFVSDYKINLIDLSNLPDEQVKLFKSDFRSLIDWLKKQKDPDYEVDPRTLDHAYEFANLIYALTNDDSAVEAVEKWTKTNEGEEITMNNLIDKLHEQGFEKGKVSTLAELVNDGILTLKQAAERMGMTVAKFKAAMKELATN